MGKPLYKSIYVQAGKREDSTYGIFRNRPTNTVDCFDTPEEALEYAKGSAWGGVERIVIDIGLLLDPKIKREGNLLDASIRYEEENNTKARKGIADSKILIGILTSDSGSAVKYIKVNRKLYRNILNHRTISRFHLK